MVVVKSLKTAKFIVLEILSLYGIALVAVVAQPMPFNCLYQYVINYHVVEYYRAI